MNEPARNILESFNHSNQKDYVEWLKEAKTQTTRKKRIATTLQWLAAGKGRNWKYIKK